MDGFKTIRQCNCCNRYVDYKDFYIHNNICIECTYTVNDKEQWLYNNKNALDIVKLGLEHAKHMKGNK